MSGVTPRHRHSRTSHIEGERGRRRNLHGIWGNHLYRRGTPRLYTAGTPRGPPLALRGSYVVRLLPAFDIRSSIGFRPAKPALVSCQKAIFVSPSFQHSRTISPSTLQGKSSRPTSRSFTCTPVASISATASLARWIAFSRAAFRLARWITF